MCGCTQLSNFGGTTQQFGLTLPSVSEHSNFWPFTNKETDSTKDTKNTIENSNSESKESTTGQKIKEAINDGTIKNTSDTASSWLDTINKGINIFKGNVPVNTSTSSDGGATGGSAGSGENNDVGIPLYVWWILGGMALLGAIWAGIHFSKQA